MLFLSRRYRPNMWPFYGLVGIELCLTVALLTLTGIAAPNLYRNKLWQDGADNGFNSSPTRGLYAAANYRPYKTPRCWSQFTTNYNLVVAVLSMFFLLVKGTMYMLHVLPPVVSAVLHSILATIYAVAVAFQASSDTTDPHRLQNGPPWYITKSCSVTRDKSLVGYCSQAKATFACFMTMLIVFIIYMGLSIWSCFPSKAHQLEYAEKKRAEKARWAHLDEPDPRSDNDYGVPETPGVQLGMNPVTPRTLAFNTLGGTRGLPFRAPEKETETENMENTTKTFSLRSPGILRTPMTLGPKKHKPQPLVTTGEVTSPESEHETQPYFPPPPKASTNR